MRVPGYDHVASLYVSEQRRRVLFCLADAPSRPGELAERTETSRKTVHEALSEFIDRGWVALESGCGAERDRSGHQRFRYALTVSGDLITQLLRSENLPESGLHDDVVAFLARSEHRFHLLSLLQDQPREICDIIAAEDVARTESWLYQTMNEFADREWVHHPEGNSTYALTSCGRKTFERFATLAESVEWIVEYHSVLNQLGKIGGTLSVQELAHNRAQTTVIEASTGDPDAVLNYYSKRLAAHEPSSLQGIAPVVSSLSNQIHRPFVKNERTRIELVVDETVVDAARSSYSVMLEAATVIEGFNIFVYPERLGFGLAIFDENRRVFLSGHDDLGVARVGIDCVSESFVEWTLTLFETYQAEAIPLRNHLRR